MMRSNRLRWFVVLVPIALLFSACVDERVVFEQFRLPPLPEGAANFVGYSDQRAKRTVCGNCHVGQQADWVQTAHASAWKTLADNPGRQALCEGCHSVGQRGNAVSTAAGWEATRDVRYQDVQCESCHGPGLAHVTNPDLDSNHPQAPLAVGATLNQGCGECHSGNHHPFVEEWQASGHGRVIASPAGRDACNICHTGENVLLAWGVRSDYQEKERALSDPATHLPITCGVCHDPHANDRKGQLRFPIDVPNEEQNLCMKCHHKRGTPDPTTFRGPHSPEGPVLLGYGGWWPPLLQFVGDTIAASHGSARNPRLCAGCHVNSYRVNDKQTGQFQVQVTGHSFAAIPCVDANGAPTTGDCTLNQRSFRSCAGSGCHATEAVARGLYTVAETRVVDLVSELKALLARVPASEFVVDNRYTTAEGARFNQQLGERKGSAIHNPLLLEALLRSSIRQVRQDYNLPAQTAVSLEQLLGK